ncbi:MAG TPA: hydroxymethylpyrimidine/phosphomethylpyrimidine kinase [Kofleriaceae bacterium]|nr:hydroxymethylpyrimidine/phosphomethylpyrimidine kinase [Kofleriaceae bacterium]
METHRPDVLICAGLDPSGGAGVLADARVIAELGGRPVGVVTALTVQNTTAVIESEPVSAELIRGQLEFLLSDVEVRAVKIGMIGSSEVAKSIAAALALTGAPVVWDPVIQPSRGDVPFIDNLFGEALEALLPHVTVLTPNALELAFLTGAKIADASAAAAAGQALAGRLATAVLVKGGHLGASDGDESVDFLCTADRVEPLRGPRLPAGEHVHGTGCALSSAIAAHLARGGELLEACRAAKAYVAARIAAPARPGRGAAAIV